MSQSLHILKMLTILDPVHQKSFFNDFVLILNLLKNGKITISLLNQRNLFNSNKEKLTDFRSFHFF